jgi:hypothetical protein
MDETAVATTQEPPQGEKVPCANPECQNTLEPVTRGGFQKKACSDACRAAAYAAAHPRWPVRPRIPREPGKVIHLKPSAMAVLGRLLQGPATTHELMNLHWIDPRGREHFGMLDFRSRLSELRRANYNIPFGRRLREGSSVFVLIQEES